VVAGDTPVLVHNCGPVPNSKGGELSIDLMEADLQGVKPAFGGTEEFNTAMSGSGRHLWAVDESGKVGIVPARGGIKHSVIFGGNPVTGATATYSYNADSLVSGISYGSGKDTQSFGYDSQHRLASDTLKTSSGTAVASVSYGYNADSEVTIADSTAIGWLVGG